MILASFADIEALIRSSWSEKTKLQQIADDRYHKRLNRRRERLANDGLILLGARDDIVEPGVMEAVVRAVECIRHRAPIDGSLELSRPIGPLLDLRAAFAGPRRSTRRRSPRPPCSCAERSTASPTRALASRLRPTTLVEHVIDDATHWLMDERPRERLFDLAARFIHHG